MTGETSGATAGGWSPRSSVSGVALVIGGSISNQMGAGVGALAFPAIGPVGVVAVRQIIAALVLLPVGKPRFRAYSRTEWWPILGLALSFSVMNICLYSAVDRIGLGLAVTLEFLGPLAVAIMSARRAAEIMCAVVAGTGVVVLTAPGPSTDVVGVALALTAAAAWAGYILVNRQLGQRLPGIEGTSAASIVTATVWVPIGAIWFTLHTPTVTALLLALACGVLSSAIPYAIDLLALRRVSTEIFGTLSSFHPVVAALAGWAMLGQSLSLNEWSGMALIIAANVVVTSLSFRRGPRPYRA